MPRINRVIIWPYLRYDTTCSVTVEGSAVDGGDVGVVQRGGDFRFALKPGEPIGGIS